ncbi:aromatic ring-hydroxylating dioxygenase subunit alpha [Streptomyces sp. NPDC005799]|uniref:aromatic ring-hydroxylating oxygenase subunit alpha n=1 Tax=Streptomyces sp. NPDC005799 TaxID=3154678 RepID=UPI00340485A2
MTQLSESSSEQTDVEALIEKKVAGRSGKTYQQVVREDGDEIPDFLRPSWTDLGDEDIPAERYTSKEFLQLEVEHVWRKAWQMACREEEIPEPGDHVVYEIVNDSFIVTRTPGGQIKAFQNACLHRGRRLRTVDGRVPELRCPFHGWTWDLDGGIKKLPCGDWDFKHVDQERFALPEVKVGTWGGFVFINMDPDCEPLEEFLAPIPDHFKHTRYEERYKSVHVAQVVSANWKVALEAFIEAYHLPATHPQTAPSIQDYMSQVDLFGKNVNRVLSARGVSSSTLGELEEEDIYESYLEARTFYEERLGTNSRDVPREILEGLPEGMTARQRIVNTIREELAPRLGLDLRDTPAYQLMDAVQYFVFPNFFPWDSGMTNIYYRFRPNGNDPDSCILEIFYLTPVPEGQPRPEPAKVHWLERDGDWLDAPELGSLGAIVNQDRINMPEIQRGLKALPRTKPGITLASYQESRIRHFHARLMDYINDRV